MYERYQVRASIEKRERHWPLRSEPISILRSHRFRSLRLKTTIVSWPLVRDIQIRGKKKNQIKWSKVYFYLKTFKKSITSAQLSIYLFFLFLLINIKNKKIRKNPIFQTWSFSKTYRSFYCRYVILFRIICGWRQ